MNRLSRSNHDQKFNAANIPPFRLEMEATNMPKKSPLTLTVAQLLAILKALPQGTHFFEESWAQGRKPSYVGTRDKIIEVFSHPAQDFNAPAWNDSNGLTNTLYGLHFMLIEELEVVLPACHEEFCVLLEYNYADENENLPRLPILPVRARKLRRIQRPESDRTRSRSKESKPSER